MGAERYRSPRPPRADSPRPSGPRAALALDHVQVAAPPECEAAARIFYGELLGLVELDRPAALRGRGGAWFALDGGRALHVGVVDAGFAAAAKAHPALRAPDELSLRELAERLAAAGHAVAWDGPLPGVSARFFTADPWGNRLELLAGPGADAPRPLV